MSLPTLIAIVLGLALTAYGVLGGADFGAGILDLLARQRPGQRVVLARTIGPVWEANHVWLIFSITILFSTFPPAFAALGTATLVPLTLAVIAIVVRGVAFALRTDPAGRTRSDRLLGSAFGTASMIAPFLFGACAAALAEVSTGTRTDPTPQSLPWTGVFAVTVGLLTVALCTQLAAGLMTSRLARSGSAGDADSFRRRGLQTGASVLALGLLALIVAAAQAPALWSRLSTTALPLVAAGLVAGVAALYGFASRRYRLARGATVVEVAAVLWGWLISQSPRLVGTHLTIHTAAATQAALNAVAISGAVVLLAVIPAFYLLYLLFRHPSPQVTR